MTAHYTIEGMNCQHCRQSAEQAIAAVEGVEAVSVDLASKRATVNGSASPEAIIAAVSSAGFTATAI